jgi:hypothetical protein
MGQKLGSNNGEEGWPFIEESSYKVLFEAILEDLEKEEQENVNIF